MALAVVVPPEDLVGEDVGDMVRIFENCYTKYNFDFSEFDWVESY